MTVMSGATNQPNISSMSIRGRTGIWLQSSVSLNSHGGPTSRWMVDPEPLHGEEAAKMARVGKRALARRLAEDSD